MQIEIVIRYVEEEVMATDEHGPKRSLPETAGEVDHGFLQWKSDYLISRREYDDTSMWQAPALGLTAQAFLLTIALDSTVTNVGRIIASILALITAVASLYLIYRKRFQARVSEQEFDELAKLLHPGRNFGASFEERAKAIDRPIPLLLRRPATDMWILALYVFVVADLYIIVLTATGSITLLPP
jgi:hypothetical protein